MRVGGCDHYLEQVKKRRRWGRNEGSGWGQGTRSKEIWTGRREKNNVQPRTGGTTQSGIYTFQCAAFPGKECHLVLFVSPVVAVKHRRENRIYHFFLHKLKPLLLCSVTVFNQVNKAVPVPLFPLSIPAVHPSLMQRSPTAINIQTPLLWTTI